jgi:hypothetical protein
VLRFHKSKSLLILGILAALIGLYALAGFVLAPKLIRSALLKDIPETIGVTPAVGRIRINPFLLQVTVEDFSLAGAGGAKLLGFQRLFVDFELSSLWHRAYSFGSIDIAAPFVNAAVARDGTLNLLQLRPKPAPAPKPAEQAGPLPRVRIASFKVTQGTVSYEDHSQADLFSARLEPITFELREFTTGVEGGQFVFTGASKQGERIEWHGHVSVQPIESDGEFRVDGLLARTIWDYLQDKVNFVLNSGSLDLAATYKFTAAGGAPAAGAAQAGPGNLEVAVSKVALSNLTVRPKGSGTDWITVPSFTVTGTTFDLAQRQAHVDLVSLTGVKVLAWLESDGALNLMKLTQPAAGAPGGPAAPAPTLTASSSGPAAPAPPWRFDVRQFEMRDADLSVEDRKVNPAVKIALAPFALTVNGASQDLGKPVAVALQTRINQRGSLNVDGRVTPQPAAADLSVNLKDLDLAVLQPYIAQHSAMTLLSGLLGTDAKVHYGARDNLPTVQFAGEIDVSKVHTVDDALHKDFINWDRLEIVGVNFTQGPDRLDIEQIVARKAYARVIIEADESLNVKRVLLAPGSAAAPEAKGEGSEAKGEGSEAKGEGSEAKAPPLTAKNEAPSAQTSAGGAKRTRGAATAAPATSTMPVSVKKILVQAGQANFSDLSVQPNFSTGIQGLSGSIVGLSSRPNSRAKMDLHGSIDAYSPVAITGEFNVLGPKLYTDVSMSFRNIELTIFNPYSGKFAGYNISKGKLTTELHYKVDGRALDAQHHIVVDQLEFGDKTASKDAVSLPIKLAVSLLKDRNGVIDLNLPVTGSLDDPHFRIGPVIWKIFVNLLEKAVTAPFALLGSLFGGGPDIQYIDFPPGVSTLDAAATDKLKAVAKALAERPQLKIEVPIGVVPDIDRPALVAARLSAELAAAQTSAAGSRKAASAPPAPFDQLEPAAQAALLTKVYTQDLGGPPKFPDAITQIKSKPDMLAAKIDFMSTAVREHAQVGDNDLKSLGQDRAKSLQQVLLAQPEVAGERVFLVANDKATAKDGAVRLELTLQ